MPNNSNNHLFALFNAGGGGTRLWPRSRNKTPKQFLKLFGKKTLTQLTAERYSKILPWERIIIVTTSDHYKKELLRIRIYLGWIMKIELIFQTFPS